MAQRGFKPLIFDAFHLAATAVIGLLAGVLGGLAGVGGSMVMLPALHFLLGDEPESVHHLYMAAAMTVNILVSVPAALRHHRVRAVRTDLLPNLLVSASVAIVVGVLIGNLVSGNKLKLGLAAFLLAYCAFNLVHLIRRSPEHAREHERTQTWRLTACGVGTGMIAGLLGLGGGVLLVPMLQVVCRVGLKNAIATSSAVICLSAVVGAGLKLASLPAEQPVSAALILAASMGPTAVIGGLVGARLTHALPIRAVRIVVTILLAIIAVRLAELPELLGL